MSFDSLVVPQVNLGNPQSGTNFEGIESALEKYNEHTHAIANTGNVYEMGLALGYTVEHEYFPVGTTITELAPSGNLNSFRVSANALGSEEPARIIINSIPFDNCAIIGGGNIVTLNPQHGFISSNVLRRCLSSELNGVLTFPSNPQPDQDPYQFILFANPSSPHYLFSISLVLTTFNSVDTSYADIELKQVSSSNETTLWNTGLDTNRITQSFPIQQSDNTTLFDSSSNGNKLILTASNLSGDIAAINYYLRLYKVAL